MNLMLKVQKLVLTVDLSDDLLPELQFIYLLLAMFIINALDTTAADRRGNRLHPYEHIFFARIHGRIIDVHKIEL
jgi:hypothetical protein